jgi:hypothetical protein
MLESLIRIPMHGHRVSQSAVAPLLGKQGKGERRVRGISGVQTIAPLMLLLAGTLAFGQAGGPLLRDGQQVPPTLPHLYWHFLMVQNRLDQLAAKWDQEGKDGSMVRSRFQQRLGFTDAQFALVRSTAQRLESELKTVDAQAMAIINTAGSMCTATGVAWRACW